MLDLIREGISRIQRLKLGPGGGGSVPHLITKGVSMIRLFCSFAALQCVGTADLWFTRDLIACCS